MIYFLSWSDRARGAASECCVGVIALLPQPMRHHISECLAVTEVSLLPLRLTAIKLVTNSCMGSG